MSRDLLVNVSENAVARITLNRPDVHNAFDDALIQDLLKTLQQLEADKTVKLIHLSAAGKNFSAGADIQWMKRTAAYSHEENIKDAAHLSDLMRTLKFLNKPTIAQVQGAALGGGVGLIACCDIAIASTDATFALSEVKIGLIPAVISPYVIAAMGERTARRYMLTGEKINAMDAKNAGFIHEVAAPDALETATQEIIQTILANSPQAVFETKKLINRVAINPYDSQHLVENAKIIADIRVSKEGQEGLTAFLEKRKPVW